MKVTAFCKGLLVFSCYCLVANASASDSSWLSNPVSSDYYNGSNWTAGVPTGATDVASFGTSSQKSVSLTNAGGDLNIGGFSVTDNNYAFSFNAAGLKVIYNTSGFVSTGSNTTFALTSNNSTVQFSNAPARGVQFTVSNGVLLFSGSASADNTVSVVLASAGKFFNQVGGLSIGSISGTSSVSIELGADLSVGSNNVDNLVLDVNVINNTGSTFNFNKQGTGNLIFSRSTSARINLNINGGSFQLGNNGTTGTVTNTITAASNTKLIFNHSNTQSRSALINGAGVMRKLNSNTLTLSGNNGYSGGTELVAGILIAGNNNAFGSGTINVQGNSEIQSDNASRSVSNAFSINNGVVLSISGANNLVLGGAFSGLGAINKTSNISLTMSGNSNYSGDTTLSGGGTIIAGNNNCFGTGRLLATANTSLQSNNSSRSLANNIVISSGITLALDGANNLTLSGDISGSGILTKSVATTLILSGNNSYSGGTTVSNGILQGTTASIQGTVTNNASVIFNQTADGTYSGNMTGTGALTKNGNGKLILSGINNLGSTTNVNAGTLQVDGSLTSNLAMNSTAILKGIGTIVGNVISTGATITPGNSIGTLTITGNLTLDSASTTTIEISPSANSLLDISGTATLNGILNINYQSGTYATKDYTILTAASTSGTFSNLTATNLPSGITSTFQVLANSVLLKLVNNSSNNTNNLAENTNTSQAAIIANFMTQVENRNPTTQQQQLFNALNSITDPDQLDNALYQIAPTIIAGFQSVNICAQQQMHISKRLAALHTSNYYVAGDLYTHYSVWVRPFYEGGKQKNLDSLLGYKANTTGIVLGVDKEITSDFILGLAGSYAYSVVKSINFYNTATNIKTYLATIYGANTLMYNVHLDWLISAGQNNYSGNRTLNVTPVSVFASATYNGQQYAGQAILSKDFKCLPIILSPQASAFYVHLHQQAYSEAGAGTLGMTVNENNSSVFTLGIGLRTSAPRKERQYCIIPEAHVMGYYDAKSGAQNITSSFVTGGPTLATSATPGRITGQFGASLVFNFSEHLSFKAEYDLLIKNLYYNNVAFVNIKYSF